MSDHWVQLEIDELKAERNLARRNCNRLQTELDTTRLNATALRQALDGVPAPMPREAWDHEATDAATHAWLSAYARWYPQRFPTADGLGGRRSGW